MKYFLKPAAYGFIALLIMQSCIVYKKQSIPIMQATDINDRIIKIITVDGTKHKLNWIDENNGNVVSIKRTKKKYVDIKKIKRIKVSDPERREISLDSALRYDGIVEIETAAEDFDFINIEKYNDRILGTSMTGKDTVRVIIPKSDIAQLKVQNKGLSNTGNVFIGAGVILGVTIWIASRAEINPL